MSEERADLFSSVASTQNQNVSVGSGGRTPEVLTPLANGQDNRLSSWEDNPLSKYFQVAYHWKFYAVGDGGSSIVIAETGKTTYNIREVQIKSAVAPTAQFRNTATSQFRIVIAEPMGISFLDGMWAAKIKAGSDNWMKSKYRLELSFMGYDEKGTIVPNICSPFPNGGNWTWDIQINDIDVSMDAGGGVYTITAVSLGNIGLDHDYVRPTSSFNITAETLGDFFKKLAEKMNEKNRKDWKGTQMVEYAFDLKKLKEGDDPSKWKIRGAGKSEYENYRSLSFNREDREFYTLSGIRGAAIPDIVNDIMAICPDAQAKLLDGANGSGSNVEELAEKAGSDGKFRYSLLFMVHPVVELVGIDEKTNDYKKKITYTIKSYRTHVPTVDAQEIKNSQQNSQQAITSLKQINGLQKRYDYIYTGLNTEVIQFDCKFNFAWAATVPRDSGQNYYHDNIEVNAFYNSKARDKYKKSDAKDGAGNSPFGGQNNPVASLIQTGEKALGGALNSAVSGVAGSVLGAIGGGSGAGSSNPFSQAGATFLKNSVGSVATAATSTINRLGSSLSDAGSRLGQAASAYTETAATSGQTSAGKSSDIYVEDILNPESSAPLPIAIRQSGEVARNNAGHAGPGQYTTAKSLYGALIEQQYEGVTAAFNNITLQIKGDPYWLGQDTPLMLEATNTNYIANYTEGDCAFVLIVKYPYNWGETGTYELRTQDVLTGVFRATQVESHFQNGMFTQTLTAIRLFKIDVKALNLEGTASKTGTTAGTTATSTSKTQVPNATFGPR